MFFSPNQTLYRKRWILKLLVCVVNKSVLFSLMSRAAVLNPMCVLYHSGLQKPRGSTFTVGLHKKQKVNLWMSLTVETKSETGGDKTPITGHSNQYLDFRVYCWQSPCKTNGFNKLILEFNNCLSPWQHTGSLTSFTVRHGVSGFEQPITVRIHSVNVQQDAVWMKTALVCKTEREADDVHNMFTERLCLRGVYVDMMLKRLTDVSSDFIQTLNWTVGQYDTMTDYQTYSSISFPHFE